MRILQTPTTFRHREALALMALALTLSGCGGLGGGPNDPPFPEDPFIQPDPASLAPSATETFVAGGTGPIVSIVWEIREGASGGSVVPYVINGHYFGDYTAPAMPGTYHLDVAMTLNNAAVENVTATITVQ